MGHEHGDPIAKQIALSRFLDVGSKSPSELWILLSYKIEPAPNKAIQFETRDDIDVD